MSLFNFGFTSSKRKNDEVSEDRNQQKKVYEEKRERKYLGQIWEKKYVYFKTTNGKPDGKTTATTWISYDKEKNSMYCSVCTEFPTEADTESTLYRGCTNIRDAPLKSHSMSVKHETCVKHKIASLFPREQPMDRVRSEVTTENKRKC